MSSSFLVLVLCLGAVRGLYFHISETEQKCFIEEVPSETMIVGKFLVNAHHWMNPIYIGP